MWRLDCGLNCRLPAGRRIPRAFRRYFIAHLTTVVRAPTRISPGSACTLLATAHGSSAVREVAHSSQRQGVRYPPRVSTCAKPPWGSVTSTALRPKGASQDCFRGRAGQGWQCRFRPSNSGFPKPIMGFIAAWAADPLSALSRRRMATPRRLFAVSQAARLLYPTFWQRAVKMAFKEEGLLDLGLKRALERLGGSWRWSRLR